MQFNIALMTAWIQVYSVFIVAFASILLSIIKRKKLISLIEAFYMLDKKLNRCGANISYQWQKRKATLQFYGLLIVPIFFSMVNCFVLNSVSKNYPCYMFICFTPIAIIALKQLKFYKLLSLLRDKFYTINDMISVRMLRKMSNESARNASLISIYPMKKIRIEPIEMQRTILLQNIAYMHADLTDMAESIQECFGIYLLLIITSSFLILTIQIYYLFAYFLGSLLMDFTMIVLTIFWIMVQVGVICINVNGCMRTSEAVIS